MDIFKDVPPWRRPLPWWLDPSPWEDQPPFVGFDRWLPAEYGDRW